MNTIEYLKKTYGYDTPIFLKDIRIGRKSKTAIKQDLYRACKNGEIKREANGVYFLKGEKEFGSIITFDEIVHLKYISESYSDSGDRFERYGYYSGLTFLNIIGLSQQLPADLEITTNNTSSKKRFISIKKRRAILRKARVKVTNDNWKTLQFLDMFHFLTFDEVLKNKNTLQNYIKQNLSIESILAYLPYYQGLTTRKLTEGGIIEIT